MSAAGEPAGLPVDAGLCAGCRYRRLLQSRRSTFLFCGRSEADARFPRYPRLPVLACAGYAPRGSDSAAADPA